MKLLHRIQALDASRRRNVMKRYIPVLLIEDNGATGENENKIVVGHIHSNLVETLRTELSKRNDTVSIKDSFVFPPLQYKQIVPTSLSSPHVVEPLDLVRDRFFGLRVGKTQGRDPSNELTDARNVVFERFTDLLLECKIISKRHTDMYPIVDLKKEDCGILATVNRNAAPYLGIVSVGVHLLCYVRDLHQQNTDDSHTDPNNISLWLAQRAANKSHNALRWDPTVAGGQPVNLGFLDNVVKESSEEAGISPDLVMKGAMSKGCLSQMTCKPDGTCMKPSLYYIWDLQVDPNTFVPKPADGEVSVFELYSAKQLEHEVRHGDRLRPAMILVVTDFLIRHGIITPDNEPDYARIISAMHRERLVLEFKP